MNEERLIELEIKISHQDVAIEELHQVVFKQQEQIDDLQAKVLRLIKRFDETVGTGLPSALGMKSRRIIDFQPHGKPRGE